MDASRRDALLLVAAVRLLPGVRAIPGHAFPRLGRAWWEDRPLHSGADFQAPARGDPSERGTGRHRLDSGARSADAGILLPQVSKSSDVDDTSTSRAAATAQRSHG